MATDPPASSSNPAPPNLGPIRDYSPDGLWKRGLALKAQHEQLAKEQYAKQRREKQAENDDAYLANLSPAQQRAVEMTVRGAKDTHIARELHLSTRTLYRWKTDDPEYIDALEQARMQTHFSVNDQFRSLLSRSTGIFNSCLRDSDKDVQFRAAHALLMMNGSFKPLPAPCPNDDDDDDTAGPLPPVEWSQGAVHE